MSPLAVVEIEQGIGEGAQLGYRIHKVPVEKRSM